MWACFVLSTRKLMEIGKKTAGDPNIYTRSCEKSLVLNQSTLWLHLLHLSVRYVGKVQVHQLGGSWEVLYGNCVWPSCPGSSNAAMSSPDRGSGFPALEHASTFFSGKKKVCFLLPWSPLLNLPGLCLSWRWICVFFHDKDHLTEVTCSGFPDTPD